MIPSQPPPTLQAKDDFSQLFNSFIQRCLTKNPNDRPSAIELLNVINVTLIIKGSVYY